MAIPNQSEKSVALDREENITKGNLSAKKVALYTYNSGTDTLEPYTGSDGASFETIFDDTTEAGNIYLGKATPGTAYSAASWQIKKFNGTTKATTFADDVTTYTKTWNDRTTYNY